MKKALFVTALTVLAAFYIQPAVAAKRAVVETETQLLKKPQRNSEVISTLEEGDDLVISNRPKKGYYKARSSSGKVGWVSARDVSIKGKGGRKTKRSRRSKERSESRRSYRDAPKWDKRVTLLGGLGLFNSKELGTLTGFGDISNGVHFGGEFHYMFNEKIGAIFRAEYIVKSISALNSDTSDTQNLDVKSLPVMLGVGYTLKAGDLSFRFSALGGLALSTSVEAQTIDGTTGEASGEATKYSTSTMTFMGKVDVDYYASSTVSVFIEAGYRMLKTADLTEPTSSGGSNSLFQDGTGAYTAFPINLTGLVVGGGLAIHF